MLPTFVTEENGGLALKLLPNAKRAVRSEEVRSRPLADYVYQTSTGASEFLKSRWPDRPELHRYLGDGSLRFALIAEALIENKRALSGPTLDVASEDALLLPLVEELAPDVTPYSLSELEPKSDRLTRNGNEFRVYPFHCERDVFPEEDEHFGFVLFCEVLEHLMQDPVWTMVQLNRVVQTGGHLLLTTPNAGSILRLGKILACETAAGFVVYKPIEFFLRHYREYSANEVQRLLEGTGFEIVTMKTGADRFQGRRWNLLLLMLRSMGLLRAPLNYYGRATVCLARKVRHIASPERLSQSERWPPWLYSQHDEEHQRPERFLVQ